MSRNIIHAGRNGSSPSNFEPNGSHGDPRTFGGLLVLIALLTSGPASADESQGEAVLMPLGAQVIEVIDEHTVVINRGRSSQMPADGELRIYGRQSTGSKAVDLDAELCRGTVKALSESAAVITLHHKVAPVTVGSFVIFKQRIPRSLARSGLFVMLARDVRVQSLTLGRDLVTLAELWANDTPAYRAAALDRLTAEVRSHHRLASQVHSGLVAEGRFAGLTLATALRRTTRRDLAAFTAFVARYPGKYMGHRWKLVEIYGTWIINGAPTR